MRQAIEDYVWGICQKSGMRVRRVDMVEDGYYKGLMVAPQYYDPPHPQERIMPIVDTEAIEKPYPDLDAIGQTLTFPFYDMVTDTTYAGANMSLQVGTIELDLLDTVFWYTDDDLQMVGDGALLVFNEGESSGGSIDGAIITSIGYPLVDDEGNLLVFSE